MPHKKNPDILELIRGETAGLYSNLNEVLVLLKGLPLTYNRDLQLDKPPLFQSVEKVAEMLELLTKLFAGLKVNKSVVEKRITDPLDSLFQIVHRGKKLDRSPARQERPGLHLPAPELSAIPATR